MSLGSNSSFRLLRSAAREAKSVAGGSCSQLHHSCGSGNSSAPGSRINLSASPTQAVPTAADSAAAMGKAEVTEERSGGRGREAEPGEPGGCLTSSEETGGEREVEEKASFVGK